MFCAYTRLRCQVNVYRTLQDHWSSGLFRKVRSVLHKDVNIKGENHYSCGICGKYFNGKGNMLL